MSARPFIDSLDFAVNGKEINGVVQVSELSRLRDVLNDSQGVLSYTVRGGLDNRSAPVLEVGVSGQCELLCQRCLDALAYPVQFNVRLMLRNQAELDALDSSGHVDGQPDDAEAFDSILAETQLDVLNLLEEEILLSLPIAPRHEPGECQAAGAGSAAKEAERPFAALAKLKVVK